MANLKSAIKRVRSNNKTRTRNQAIKSDMRTEIKRVENLIEANDLENAKIALQRATRKIDKTVQKGIIHKNNGARQKSRLASQLKKASG